MKVKLLAVGVWVVVIGVLVLFELDFFQGFLSGRETQADSATVEENNTFNKPLKKPLPNPRIVIYKSRRKLYLYSCSEIVRVYKIAIGDNPEGDKLKEGDCRTPEGEYYICVKNPYSKYYLSLGLSYPNVEDAKRGLKAGLITRQQYKEIQRAIRKKRKPPWKTPMGGEIFIHGHASKRESTLGCIALYNEDMKELYENVPLGTSVIIFP